MDWGRSAILVAEKARLSGLGTSWSGSRRGETGSPACLWHCFQQAFPSLGPLGPKTLQRSPSCAFAPRVLRGVWTWAWELIRFLSPRLGMRSGFSRAELLCSFPLCQAQNRAMALSETSLPRGQLRLQTQLTGSDPKQSFHMKSLCTVHGVNCRRYPIRLDLGHCPFFQGL